MGVDFDTAQKMLGTNGNRMEPFSAGLESTTTEELKRGNHLVSAGTILDQLGTPDIAGYFMSLAAKDQSDALKETTTEQAMLDQQGELAFVRSVAKTYTYMQRTGLQCLADGVGSRINIPRVIAIEHARIKAD